MAFSPSYQDIGSAVFGGMGSASAGKVQDASSQVQKNLINRQYGRDKMSRQNTRNRIDLSRNAEQAYRALPGAYNQRGMIDSGSFVRGGRETAANVYRAQNRINEDFGQSIMDSWLQDSLDMGNLSELRQGLASQDYQNLVASLYGDQMRGA
tara:strand:- start:2675 stop:3130 length:456 start_codon:yes stop_codon:yes gene_type:complete